MSITNANGTFYYHRDHQGSIIALTDENGQVVESFTYDNHYGAIINHTETVETNNPYAYTGREYDAPDLYYYRARYYDPTLERFISEDPIGFASGDFNWYRYVMNSPVNLVDPWGLWSLSFEFYDFFGGGLTFGKNPDNKFFLSIKMGIGLGGGVAYDPNGKSNNYKSNGCYDFGVGFSGGAYISPLFSTFGYEGSFGVTSGGKTIPGSLYHSSGPNNLYNDNTKGINASINANGEFIFIW